MSDGHLLASNVEDVCSVPPPLSQGSTGKPFRHQTDNRLKTCSTDMASSLLGHNGIPYQDPAGATLTRIWG